MPTTVQTIIINAQNHFPDIWNTSAATGDAVRLYNEVNNELHERYPLNENYYDYAIPEFFNGKIPLGEEIFPVFNVEYLTAAATTTRPATGHKLLPVEWSEVTRNRVDPMNHRGTPQQYYVTGGAEGLMLGVYPNISATPSGGYPVLRIYHGTRPSQVVAANISTTYIPPGLPQDGRILTYGMIRLYTAQKYEDKAQFWEYQYAKEQRRVDKVFNRMNIRSNPSLIPDHIRSRGVI